eukprot:TRINITY_DN43380_c0_g1_i1.p1 TRINITY_DN43380_c0_g1~~TRINITY_DN43380_c0_g1_i1.p1  ORF type:complete len:309 (-),score=24.20 TRINITY_DN43380_c0_g1_i1:15-941(-)
MKQSPRRRAVRHMIAILFALPCLLTPCLTTTANQGRIACWTQVSLSTANYIGDASFAFTGSLAAGMENMDLLGCVIVGFVTALGGGTLRDILLGRFPIFWLTALDEYALVVLVATLTFFLWPPASTKWSLTSTGEIIFWTDTLGLAAFAASGAYASATLHWYTGLPPVHLAGCACCGMFTATFGGLTRDILIARPPRILYSSAELYAIPAFLGGLACASLLKIDERRTFEAMLLGFWTTIHARVFSVNGGLRLPTFPSSAVYSKQARPRDAAAAVARHEDLIKEEGPPAESLLSVSPPRTQLRCFHEP